jgi:Tol biopolymer transport system component
LGDNGAYWTLDEHKIVFIEGDGTNNVVLLGHPDVSETTRISQEGFNPIDVYPTHDSQGVFWSSGSCITKGDCNREALMWSSIDGTMHRSISGEIRDPIASPLGDRIVYATSDTQGRNRLEYANLDGSDPEMIYAFGNHYMDYDWSPEGNRLALIVTDRSDYSGTLLTYRYYVVNNVQVRVDELPWMLRTASELSWSNDGLQILFWGTDQDDTGFHIFMKIYDIYKGRMFELPGWEQLSSTDFVFIPHAYWVP